MAYNFQKVLQSGGTEEGIREYLRLKGRESEADVFFKQEMIEPPIKEKSVLQKGLDSAENFGSKLSALAEKTAVPAFKFIQQPVEFAQKAGTMLGQEAARQESSEFLQKIIPKNIQEMAPSIQKALPKPYKDLKEAGIGALKAVETLTAPLYGVSGAIVKKAAIRGSLGALQGFREAEERGEPVFSSVIRGAAVSVAIGQAMDYIPFLKDIKNYGKDSEVILNKTKGEIIKAKTFTDFLLKELNKLKKNPTEAGAELITTINSLGEDVAKFNLTAAEADAIKKSLSAEYWIADNAKKTIMSDFYKRFIEVYTKEIERAAPAMKALNKKWQIYLQIKGLSKKITGGAASLSDVPVAVIGYLMGSAIGGGGYIGAAIAPLAKKTVGKLMQYAVSKPAQFIASQVPDIMPKIGTIWGTKTGEKKESFFGK